MFGAAKCSGIENGRWGLMNLGFPHRIPWMQTSACWERSATSVGIQGGRPSAGSSIHINSDLQHNPENGCIIPIFQRESLVPDTCTMSEDGYHLWPSNSKLRLFKIHFCVILNSSVMARNEASMQNNSLDPFPGSNKSQLGWYSNYNYECYHHPHLH